MNRLRVISRFACGSTCLLLIFSSFGLGQPALGQAVETEAPESESEISSIEYLSSERILPSNTTGWVSIPDSAALKAALEETQFGSMMNDPEVKPFVDDLAQQFRTWLDEQNIRFGMTVEDIENVQSGEVCLAGVLRKPLEGGDDTGNSDHAIVLLVNVAGNEAKARELLDKVGKELSDREAKKEEIEFNGVKASKWSFEKPRGIRKKQVVFHTLVDGWLLAVDNENTFRDLITRLKAEEEVAPVLADTEAFQKVLEQCNFTEEEYPAHVRWFAEPFGYVQLAQAITDAQTPGDAVRDNYAEKFHEEGFSAIKGVGGIVSFATGDHETAHRTYVYAPPVLDTEERYLRAAAMLDFTNATGNQLDPPAWVPANSAGYLTFTWNLGRALEKVGYIVDKTSGTDGSFNRALESLKNDPQGPQVDMRELVGKLNDRITVCSVTNVPIDDESERMVFGIRIPDEADETFVSDSIFRLVRNDAEVVDFNGTRILVVDTAEIDDLDIDIEGDFDDQFGDDDAFGGDDLDDSDSGEADEEIKPAKPLFEKRVFAVKNGYLLIGNHTDQIKTILEQMPESPGDQLAEAEDFSRVRAALQELAGDNAPSFRHFGRLDRTLHTNYEMMRTGRMAQSKTLLAQLLNRAYTDEDTPEDFEREQQIDGSKMPEDYEGKVAKYLGPTGLVIHTLDEGWLVTGVVLKKEESQTTAKSEELAVDDN